MTKINKSIVCIIPARYASTRLPAKPLIEVKGLPLVMWTYNRAVESRAFREVYVATDDERIAETVIRFGGKAIMTSKDHKSGTDRIFEAVKSITCDFVVNLQGDEPLIPLDILSDFSKNLIKIEKMSLLTSVSNATIEEIENPNVVKAVLTAKGEALYFSRYPIPYPRDTTLSVYYKHTGIYGFSRNSLEKFCSLEHGMLEQTEKLEQLRALEHGMKIQCIIRNYYSISIDTPQDLDLFIATVK